MNKTALVGISASVLTAIAVLLATKLTENTVNTLDAGMDAADRALIREVLTESQLVDIEGQTYTYGQALSKISTTQAVIVKQLEVLTEE